MSVTKYIARGEKYWMADLWLEQSNGSVCRVRKKRFRTKKEAEEWVVKEKAKSFNGTFQKKKRQITVAEIWNDYLPLCKERNKDWKTDRARAKRLIEHLGNVKAASLTLKHVTLYRAKRKQTQDRHGKFPAVGTINREVALLRHILNNAVKFGDLIHNPLANIEMLPENNVREVVVTEQQFKTLLEKAEPQLKPILIVAYDTGLRKRTVLDLKWNEVKMKDKCIRLSQTDSKTKKKPLAIPMTNRVYEALSKLPRSTSGYVFVNPKTNMPWNQIRKVFDRARKAANLQHIRFHDLRRGFVTNARRRGVPESVVMRMSGHKTRAIFERYNIVNEEDLRVAVSRIQAGQEKELEKLASDDSEEKTGTR